MLIRCTHCNHELRVPDQQISSSGTRVLCKSCNTIFVARRPDDAATARSTSDLLPVADDPALEEALDRILDRGPLSESAGSVSDEHAFDADRADLDAVAGAGSSDPWAQVSPESLGISLVAEEPQARGEQPVPESNPRGRAGSDTGGDDVDELLDQVLRDLDREAPAAPARAGRPAEPAAGTDLFSGLSLEDLGEAVKDPPPTAAAPPAAPPGAPGLDLESILSEIRSENEPAAPRTATVAPNATRTSTSFDREGDDFDASSFADDPSFDEAAPLLAGDGSAAHEREQSLHDIYESGEGSPVTESVADELAHPMTDLAMGTGSVPKAGSERRPRAAPRTGETSSPRPRAGGGKAKAKPGSSASPLAWILAVVVLLGAIAGGGYWYLGQQRAKQAAAANSPPAGLPTFGFEQQDGELVKVKGGLAYLVRGVVRNTSPFAVYIIRVSGVLRAPDGHEVGRTASYAGNGIGPSSLARVPKAEVLTTLDTRIGEGGVNVKIEPMAAVPFTLVFWDVPSDVSNPELTASARSFPAQATPDG